MALDNEIFMLGLSLVIYVAMAITWDFQLFSAKKEEGKEKTGNNNAIKMLIVWLVVWLQPLLIQMAILYAEAASATANMLTLYTTYYQVSVYIAWATSVIFMVFFGYNILLWLSGAGSK